MWLNTKERYGKIHLWLHWLSAILIIAILICGGIAGNTNVSIPIQNALATFNQSFGIIVAILTIIRIIWVLTTPQVLLPETMSWYGKFAAKIVHTLLYLTIITLIVSGLLAVQDPVVLFWVGPTLHPLHHNTELFKVAVSAHLYAIVIIITLIVLHIAAALKHHFIDKDNVLRSMRPCGRH